MIGEKTVNSFRFKEEMRVELPDPTQTAWFNVAGNDVYAEFQKTKTTFRIRWYSAKIKKAYLCGNGMKSTDS
jgi:hypothetical protein